MNEMTSIAVKTTLKDWESDQEVRWCPGCGDYAILKAVQRTLLCCPERMHSAPAGLHGGPSERPSTAQRA